ncbi:unnamed protein product [Musa acuminata subsp. malaccensis]|uniref:(wild Malaysian banana) hypothetical protein n=1 Tax=Musa acuminata subsp. malaccensis TaxID=214687 RepID=A0A804I730_MUSAM|nr:unnamed protein product [Musa acuminata subsp. malaccensis]
MTGLFSEFPSIDLNVGSSDMFDEDWWMVDGFRGKSVTFEKAREYSLPLFGSR